MTRAELIERANEVSRLSRYAGPILSVDSDAPSVVAWLRWNDPNGIHEWRPNATEEELEQRPYYVDESEVWEALSEMLETCI